MDKFYKRQQVQTYGEDNARHCLKTLVYLNDIIVYSIHTNNEKE